MTKLIEELTEDTADSRLRIGRVIDGHPRRDSGGARAGSGVGGASGQPYLVAGGRDARRPCRTVRTAPSPARRRGCWRPATPPTSSPTAILRRSRASRDPVPHSWEGATGYLEAVSWRRQRTLDQGSPVVWLSPLAHLVDSEEMTQTQRLALVVDCANGAGAAIDPQPVRVHEHRHRDASAPHRPTATISRCGPGARSDPTASASPPPRSSTGRASSARARRRCWSNAATILYSVASI